MDGRPHPEATKDWLNYADPEGRYVLRYPHDWKVQQESADRTAVKEQGSRAELAISYLAEDCAVAQSRQRGRRLNYYFIREFTRSIAGRETLTLEFRDTISNQREFRALIPAERGCCELKWTRSEGAQGMECEAVLETMLATLEFVSSKN
jgi:hypothetical protein